MSGRFAVDLPYHLYGFAFRSFMSGREREGVEPCVLFGLTCSVSRSFGLSVLLECGAIYRELPPHAFVFEASTPQGRIEDSQAWDCFGPAEAVAYRYLTELPITLRDGQRGSYLFSVEFPTHGNGWSKHPPQSKALHALRLDDGRLTFQPGNAFRVFESSFTDADGDCSWLKRQDTVWGVEDYPEEGK